METVPILSTPHWNQHTLNIINGVETSRWTDRQLLAQLLNEPLLLEERFHIINTPHWNQQTLNIISGVGTNRWTDRQLLAHPINLHVSKQRTPSTAGYLFLSPWCWIRGHCLAIELLCPDLVCPSVQNSLGDPLPKHNPDALCYCYGIALATFGLSLATFGCALSEHNEEVFWSTHSWIIMWMRETSWVVI